MQDAPSREGSPRRLLFLASTLYTTSAAQPPHYSRLRLYHNGDGCDVNDDGTTIPLQLLQPNVIFQLLQHPAHELGSGANGVYEGDGQTGKRASGSVPSVHVCTHAKLSHKVALGSP